MFNESILNHLPDYQQYIQNIAVLALPISGSGLHGLMCGYLCAGASQQGESYLRALAGNSDDNTRGAMMWMFNVYIVSQQQITSFDFGFQLMLPNDHESLIIRAQAFGEWCEGFSQGLSMAGINYDHFDEESQRALQHIIEFAQLDYDSLDVDEDDEKALMEVSEYTRMAVLKLYNDLQTKETTRHKEYPTTH